MKPKNKGITVTGLMRQSAKYNANRISVVAGERRLTYSEASGPAVLGWRTDSYPWGFPMAIVLLSLKTTVTEAQDFFF